MRIKCADLQNTVVAGPINWSLLCFNQHPAFPCAPAVQEQNCICWLHHAGSKPSSLSQQTEQSPHRETEWSRVHNSTLSPTLQLWGCLKSSALSLFAYLKLSPTFHVQLSAEKCTAALRQACLGPSAIHQQGGDDWSHLIILISFISGAPEDHLWLKEELECAYKGFF